MSHHASPASSAAPAASAASLAVVVNDESRTVTAGTMLAGLLEEMGLSDRKGIAVAVNDSVVPRAVWPQRLLAGGDRVLVIRATQGG